jgi:hypothetical protein
MHDFCVRNRSHLGKFEAEFKKAKGVLFDEKKTEGQKSRDTIPLNPKPFLS